MKQIAINSVTGKLLLTNDGSLDENSFKKTLSSMFPTIRLDKITIICDGEIKGSSFGIKNISKNKGIVWKGSFWDLGGYANMNREIALRLPQYGYAVRIEVLPTGMQVDGPTLATLKAFESAKLRDEKSATMIIGFTPMPIQRKHKRVIFFTMMETQGLHSEFVNRCNQYANEVWVPCRFYEKVFRDNGVVRPIKVIPLGVNQDIYIPGKNAPELYYDKMPIGIRTNEVPKDTFKFMSLFGWSYRKGSDILCRSFIREFSGSDGVSLIIFSRYMGSSLEQHKEFVRNEIRGYYEQEHKINPPSIYYCGDCIPINDLPGCYGESNAFVFCSRGEGFGLPVIEAGACNVPVISSYNTAMTEYLDEDVSFIVKPNGYAPANDKLTWISEYYRNQEFAVLGEEQIEEFGKLMRFVLNNKEIALEKASRFRERILEKYTWNECAKRVAFALEN